jgi:DNA-binding protein Fis
MKCQALLAIALLLAITISGFGNSLSEEKQRSHLQMLRSETVKTMQLTTIDQAYLDTYSLLSGDNQCSRFFAGSGSRLVLDELVIRFRVRVLSDSGIGIRMSGTFTNLVEPQEGIAYRLFKQAEINRDGAFYKSNFYERLIPGMGKFPPNTREVRVLMLLHELAHLIKGSDGRWLIPNDGSDAQLSRSNTLTIESKCEEHIRAL